MTMAKTSKIPAIAGAVSEAIAAVGKPVLTAEEVDAICQIVAGAPCPGGIPQAQARSQLLQKFVASVK